MKFAFIGDFHFGRGNNSEFFLNYQLNYLEKEFFPKLQNEGVNTVVFMGDFFDSRRAVNVATFAEVKKRFLDRIVEENIQLICIVGNHDLYYSDTSLLNSYEFLKGNRNIKVVTEPEIIRIGDVPMAFCPWISNDEEKQKFQKFIAENPTRYLFGHFETRNFMVMPGIKFDAGLDLDVFKDFELVLSGHFHIRQKTGNMFYVGTPWELTWGDFGSPKGFYIADTVNIEATYQYFENPDPIHHEILYGPASSEIVRKDIDSGKYVGKIVRVVTLPGVDVADMTVLLNQLDNAGLVSYSVNESQKETTIADIDLEKELSLMELTDAYLEALYKENEEERSFMSRVMKNLYVEAKNA